MYEIYGSRLFKSIKTADIVFNYQLLVNLMKVVTVFVTSLQSQEERSDSVANEWNRLVTSYVRGIRYNVLAMNHAHRGDYQSAALIWLRASKGRICNAKILFNLALCYQNGLGITKDIGKVVHLQPCDLLIGFV